MKSVLEILKQGKERVTKGWVQHVLALTADGIACAGYATDAVSWCAVGALDVPPRDRILFPGVDNPSMRAYMFLERNVLDHQDLVEWNNDPKRTQEEVVDLFDRAINMLEMRGVSA